MVLFATHQLYGLISNPMATSFEVSSFQINNAAHIVPYSAFLSSTYRTDFPLIVCTYF
jgi:hypothetical protein